EGTATITAASEGKSGSVSLAVAPVPAVQLGLTTAPSATARNRIPFATQPVIQLQGADGRPSTRPGIAITASVSTPGSTVGGTLSATTSSTGAATFTDLYISGTAGPQMLVFTAPGLSSAYAEITLTAGLATTIEVSSGNNL